MVGIAGFADAGQLYAAALRRDHEQYCGLAQIDAIALGSQRLALLAADGLQTHEALHRHVAQAVGTAGDHRIALAGGQQTTCTGQGLGAGGAGGGQGVDRPTRAAQPGDTLGGCAQFLTTIFKALRPAVGARRALGDGGALGIHRGFRLADAGGAGAEHHADALRRDALMLEGFKLRCQLLKRGGQQAVVA